MGRILLNMSAISSKWLKRLILACSEGLGLAGIGWCSVNCSHGKIERDQDSLKMTGSGWDWLRVRRCDHWFSWDWVFFCFRNWIKAKRLSSSIKTSDPTALRELNFCCAFAGLRFGIRSSVLPLTWQKIPWEFRAARDIWSQPIYPIVLLVAIDKTGIVLFFLICLIVSQFGKKLKNSQYASLSSPSKSGSIDVFFF